MPHIKAILFDADGVLTLPEEFFSQVYARSRGLNSQPFENFFKEQFPAARIGKADLKQLIEANPELWQWQGTVDELLELWFNTEDVRNEPLLKVIQDIRKKGTPCYVATNQEKYRGQYIKNIMFKDAFDGFFISAELQAEKPNQEFYEKTLAKLQQNIPGIQAGEVMFFDNSKTNVKAASSAGLLSYEYHELQDVESKIHDL